MAIVNHIKKEINAKIVYYGPEGAGKAASLRYIYNRIKPSLRGEIKSMKTGEDSLLFFDFMPYETSSLDGYCVRFHIYTLTGPVNRDATWKMTLKGVDGLVIVVDATRPEDTVRKTMSGLQDILACYGVSPDDIPRVIQLNKCDFSGGLSRDSLSSMPEMNSLNVIQTSALRGDGVLETISGLSRAVMGQLQASGLSRRPDVMEGDAQDSAKVTGPDSMDVEVDISSGGDSPDMRLSIRQAASGISVEDQPLPAPAIIGEVTVADGVARIPVSVPAGGSERKLVISISVEQG